ncbi:MAG: Hpt domain-containing protein [Alphaproteobacteria bacterium]|nr:Hpt domain-containing protein [Alphaproteobacteria bacterium]
METPVNLDNLREMTDGDRELEEALFQEFFSSAAELLSQLTQAVQTNNTEGWRAAAHALKGTSYNLGAKKLGDYCKIAQEQNDASRNTKEEILQNISSEYERVRAYIDAGEY